MKEKTPLPVSKELLTDQKIKLHVTERQMEPLPPFRIFFYKNP